MEHLRNHLKQGFTKNSGTLLNQNQDNQSSDELDAENTAQQDFSKDVDHKPDKNIEINPSGLSKKAYRYFGLTKSDEYLSRYKLIFKDGRTMSFAYVICPVIRFDPGKGLTIAINEFQITITGRGLEILEDYLTKEQVTWIKESPSGLDDGSETVFVENIITSGFLS